MAVARVVSFDGVSKQRVEEMKREMSEGGPPEGFPSGELIMLHEPDAEKSLAILIFENDDDYQRAHEILDAMPTEDTPGKRTSVTKYDVVHRMTQ
jgi:hypothetical protein